MVEAGLRGVLGLKLAAICPDSTSSTTKLTAGEAMCSFAMAWATGAGGAPNAGRFSARMQAACEQAGLRTFQRITTRRHAPECQRRNSMLPRQQM